jgi:hypothetical protein
MQSLRSGFHNPREAAKLKIVNVLQLMGLKISGVSVILLTVIQYGHGKLGY